MDDSASPKPSASLTAPTGTGRSGLHPTNALRLQKTIGNRAVVGILRAVHTDKELLNVMQKFRSKNSHLTEAQQSKIFWAVKKATDSDEVAYAFFDYYSGWGGNKILAAEGDKLAKMRKWGRIGDTASGSDSYFIPEILDLSYDDAKLGPLLLHEFSHTGHFNQGAYQEGQSYAVEHFYATRTGANTRAAEIERLISGWKGDDGPPVRQVFTITYGVLKALQDLTTKGSSTLPPLVGKSADDGRLLAAAFMKDMGDSTAVPPKGPIAPLWNYVKANPSAVPDVPPL